ncbi:MAG: helix-turn-helix transcriptional regulator [Gemmatimonadales bacterium]
MKKTGARTDAVKRDRMVQLLRYRPRTVQELARAVALTPNGVRAHLAVLVRSGAVERVGVRHAEGPGKPPELYRITGSAESQFSVAYAPALEALVAVIGERLPSATQQALFAAAGKQLAAGVAVPPRADPAEQAKALLETLGAAASIRRHPDGAMVEGVACPLTRAVRQCPDSCEMVRTLLAEATGARVATRCRHDATPRCRFSID